MGYPYFQSPLIVQFFPTLLLWIISSLLPNLVYYTDYYLVGHWTRLDNHLHYKCIILISFAYMMYICVFSYTSIRLLCDYRTAEHHAVMRKTFIFLVLMVLVLPSLGLTRYVAKR